MFKVQITHYDQTSGKEASQEILPISGREGFNALANGALQAGLHIMWRPNYPTYTVSNKHGRLMKMTLLDEDNIPAVV